MALTVGELVSYIDAKDVGFARTVADAGRSMTGLESTATASTRRLEDNVVASLADIGRAIDDGLDPTEAIADLDRLEQALDQSLAEMLDEADRFALELDQAMEEAFEDLDEDARRAGERAAEALGDGLDDARRQARQAGDRAGEEFGDGVDNSARSSGSSAADGLMTTMKGAGWAAAGAAIGAALMEGISIALEEDALLTELAVKVGAFGPEAERLGQVAGELYAQGYGEGLGGVTTALTSVLQNIDGAGSLGDDALARMTAQAMTVGKVMDEDVGRVTAAVASMLRNDLAPNAETAFDTLIRGQQEGVNKSEDLLDTFEEYSTVFRDMGLDSEDVLNLLSQGLKAGARDADTVADSFKELGIKIKDGTSAPALKALGLNAKDMTKAFTEGGPKAREALDKILEKLAGVEDPVKRNQLALQLFGTKAEDMAGAVNGLDLDAGKEQITGFEGAVTTADATITGSMSNSTEQWKRGWGDALSWIGEQIMNAVMKWFPDPVAAWEEFSGWWTETVGPFFSDLWEDVSAETERIWNESIDWLAAVPGEVGEFFSEGWEAVASATSEWWEEITTAAGEKADELVAWVQGIPGEIGKFFSDGWNDIKTSTSTAWESIKKSASEKGEELVAWVRTLPKQFTKGLSGLPGMLSKVGSDAIQGMINGIRSRAGDISAVVSSLVKLDVIGAAKAALDSNSPSKVMQQLGVWTIDGFILGIQGSSERARTTVTNFTTMVKNAFNVTPTGADGLSNWVRTNTDALGKLASEREAIIKKMADAKAYAAQIAGNAADFASITNIDLEAGSGVGDLVGGLQERLSAIRDFANNIKDLAAKGLNKTILKQIIDAGPEKGGSLAEMLVGASGADIKAINKAQKDIEKVSKTLGKNAADALYDTGKQAGQGFLKGLQGTLKELEGMMGAIAKAVVAAAKKELGVKSPSTVFAEIGGQTMAGWILGIQAEQDAATATIADVIGSATSAAIGARIAVPGISATSTMQSVAPAAAPSLTAPGLIEGSQPSNGGGPTINMYGTTFHETVDINRFSSDVSFDLVHGRGQP